jgi:predicted transcriptional regulator
MNYVMLSISPEEAEDICFGKQTTLIRKRVPKTPATVYLYVQKKGKKVLPEKFYAEIEKAKQIFKKSGINTFHICIGEHNYLNGKVIGEFKVNETKETFLQEAQYENTLDEILKQANMTEEQLWKYAENDGFHVIPISDLVVYDKPKSPYDFIKKPNCKECWLFNKGCEYGFDICTESDYVRFIPSNFIYVEEKK